MNIAPSVQAHLDLARVEWPESLVAAPVLDRLRSVARHLPEPVTGLVIECHLGHPTRTDFGARVSARDRDETLRRGDCPPPLRRFYEAWGDDSHPASLVPLLEIGYDVADDTSPPCLCPNLEPLMNEGRGAIEGRARGERRRGERPLPLALAPPVFRVVDPRLPDELFARLDALSDALPPHGMIVPIWPGGFRSSAHAEPFLRVTISMPRLSVRDYLESVGWRGDIGALERWADFLNTSSPWLGFDADVLPGGLGPRAGIYQVHPWARANDPSLTGTLDRLSRKGLCLPDRLEGLREWVRRIPLPTPRGRARSLTLKLVVKPGQPPEVKAYLPTYDEMVRLPSPRAKSPSGRQKS